jgi:hypothetical protein
MIVSSKKKLFFTIICILFIADAMSHIYEIIKHHYNMDLPTIIVKTTFRVGLIAAILYLMQKNMTKSET